MDGAVIRQWEQILGETIHTVHRGRTYPLLKSSSGKWIAKPCSDSSHLRWWDAVDWELRQRGFNRMPPFRTDGKKWLLTAWVHSPRRATYRNRRDIQIAADLLARFHRSGRGLFTPPKSYPFYSLWERVNSRFRSFSLLLQKAERIRGEVGKILRGYGWRFFKTGYEALQRLSCLPLQQLTEWDRGLRCVSHRDLASHNLLIDKTSKAWLIDFDTAEYDLQVADLWQLLSRSLSEQSWDPAVLIEALAAYETHRRLIPMERALLTALLSFPNEFFREALGVAYNRKGYDRKKTLFYLEQIVTSFPQYLYFLRNGAGWLNRGPVI